MGNYRISPRESPRCNSSWSSKRHYLLTGAIYYHPPTRRLMYSRSGFFAQIEPGAPPPAGSQGELAGPILPGAFLLILIFVVIIQFLLAVIPTLTYVRRGNSAKGF